MSLIIDYTGEKNFPKDVVRLTRDQFLTEQWKLINDWKPRREVWPFTWGVGILAAGTAISGIYFNMRYRRKLKLIVVGEKSTHMFVSSIPALTTLFTHSMFISSPILLGESRCSACLETKAALIQSVCAVLYPIFLSPAVNFLFSYRTASRFDIPQGHEVGKIIKLWGKLTKPLIPAITLSFTLNAILAAFITYKQQTLAYRLHQTSDDLSEEEFVEEE